MDDPKVWVLFSKYLDKSNLGKPTSKMGLVLDAPQEAIEAYKKYQEYEKERINSDEEWE